MSLKIIGAGLGRTGTSSTKLALEQLGFSKCYHMRELMQHDVHLPYWEKAHATGTTDWAALFDGYQAAVDYPSAMYYQDQMTHFPDAKVLLTIRDPEEWYESALKTIYRVSKARHEVPESERGALSFFIDNAIWNGQFEGRFEDRHYTIEKYIEWNEKVIAHVPDERLLVFDVRHGWHPLCNFLGVAVPETSFPRTNTREEFNGRSKHSPDQGEHDV